VTFVVGSQCDMLFLMCRVPLCIGTDLVFFYRILLHYFAVVFDSLLFFSFRSWLCFHISLLNYRILAGRGERKSA